jgi:hypothetical protein
MIIDKLRSVARKLVYPSNSSDNLSKQQIDNHCTGYSGEIHWRFFKKVLRNPAIKAICVLGVYYGRDIGYMATILHDKKRTDWKVTGVDKFEDSAGTDWPEEKRGLKWEEAGYGPAPSLEKARECLASAGVVEGVELRKDTAENFLKEGKEKFDFIYIDIAHDYQTTRDTIRLAMMRLKDGGVIAGDDFSNVGTWGVARAVEEAFSKFGLYGNWIWRASKSDYRGTLT